MVSPHKHTRYTSNSNSNSNSNNWCWPLDGLSKQFYISTPKSPVRRSGTIMRNGVEEMEGEGASLARAAVVKTSWKLMSLLL